MIDRKTFYASAIFFLVVLVNPRDFPFNNIPLIYPAFLYYAYVVGPNNIIKGFKITQILSVLVIVFWFYYRGLILIDGGTVGLKDVPYLVEPLLIFGVAGSTGLRPGGTKAAIWAFVTVITISTAFGIWIFFIGEPVSSWRTAIHTSIGGTLLSGPIKRGIDSTIDPVLLNIRNTGLSYAVFSFSYQLAAAASITLAAMFSKKSFPGNKLVLYGLLLILVVGVITNTERASIMSVFAGLLSFFIITKRKILNIRTIAIGVIIAVLISMAVNNFSESEKNTLMGRNFISEKMSLRAYMVIPSFGSIFHEPFGSGQSSDYYNKIAKRVGWVNSYGEAVSAHNHFANTVLATGIIGLYLTILLIWLLWKKIKYVQLSLMRDDSFLVIACITMIVHSFTHNAGFFHGGITTYIVFGMLWSATSNINKYRNMMF